MRVNFFRLSVISAPIHDDDEATEIAGCFFQRFFVRFTAHADPEVKSAGHREGPLTPCFRYLFVDFDLSG